jgi:3-hydroxypropanoate dehydrogenase
MINPLGRDAQDQIFLAAQSANRFLDKEVSDTLLKQLYDVMKWGPTSMNCQSTHLLFIKGAQAKHRLQASLMPGNQAKTLAAPVTVIVASDLGFHQHMPEQFPVLPHAKQMFEDNESLSSSTAFRNSSLQGAYLIMAARMLGLACGPMSGFDNRLLDSEFFPDGRYQSNFLINLGYGDDEGNHPRGPRLSFEQIANII